MTHDEYEAELAAEREKRIALLRAARGVMATALNVAQKRVRRKGAPLNHIVMGVRMVCDQLRLEFRAAEPAATDEPNAAPPKPAEDPLTTIRLYRPAG